MVDIFRLDLIDRLREAENRLRETEDKYCNNNVLATLLDKMENDEIPDVVIDIMMLDTIIEQDKLLRKSLKELEKTKQKLVEKEMKENYNNLIESCLKFEL